MDHESEYNIDGSLLGLGPDILLDLMSEMKLPQDIQQILVSFQITPIFIIKESYQGKQVENKFIHSDEDQLCTITIDPIISEGIVRIEIILENTGGIGYSMGIADTSCSFTVRKAPLQEENREKIVSYSCFGNLDHITRGPKNQRYYVGQKVGIEVDMTTVPRKVTFFVDDVEQPNYVIGIPSEIRFWAYIYFGRSSFTVTKFERLIKSSAKGVEGSKVLEWGKTW
ncbi:MAG: hypothetical protein EZS28_000547 [Streblomastix strix]|uniref:SPRY domain-containing protein n=1 Tax=Streblomastix strix TaxID=222440 RepID=A0A5J4X9U6_9EUKA|nr:MAG: hypothetical protein EZS28_000547 [Streblomastix strix]